ncbi:MAG TPA: hypothetical protein VFK44_04020 [Bacillales bacterium]|nr:hypothetical protein [Bacillales bacterium]
MFVFVGFTTYPTGILAAFDRGTQARAVVAKTQTLSMNLLPQQQSTVLVSFKDLQVARDLKALAEKYHLKIEKIYQVCKTENDTFTGLYIKKDDETLEAALKHFKRQLLSDDLAHMEAQLASMKKELAARGDSPKTEADRKAYEAYQILYKDKKAERDSILAHGLKFYGIKFSARNADIVSLSHNPAVRLIERANTQSMWNPVLP